MNTTAIDTAPPAPSDYYCLTEAPPRNGTLLGFWIYLMSDCFIFASLFACYAVLGTEYAGGPTGAEVLDLPGLAVNTALLLVASVVFGFGMLEMQRLRKRSEERRVGDECRAGGTPGCDHGQAAA